MATKGKQEVVQQQSSALQFTQDRPDWMKNENRGSENVGSKDILLPRLEIIQSESPIKDQKPDEAREGLMFNTVTGDILGDTVYLVPIYYRMEYLVWKDQDAGGGFFGAFDTQHEAESRKMEVVSDGEDPDEIEIIDTPVHYCLRLREDGSFEQIVVSMSKSKAKVSRKWNSVVQICGGDRFSRAYKVTTFKDKNKQNKAFQNYIVQPAGWAPKDAYEEAERLYNVFRSTGVKTDHASGGRGDNESGGMDTDAI